MMTFNEDLEQARGTFPFIVEEFERLRLWVFTLCGEHVAMPGGPTVEAPASEHVQAAAELEHLKGDPNGLRDKYAEDAAALRKAEAQA